MPNFTITINDKVVTKKLEQISVGMRDMRKPLSNIGSDLIKFYGKDVFNSQGKDLLGSKWQPLSAATLKMRGKRTGHYRSPSRSRGRTLVWTGRMQKGFEKTVGRVKLVVKNTVPYFKHHQAPKGSNPPQRQMLGINKKVISIVNKEFKKFFKNKLLR